MCACMGVDVSVRIYAYRNKKEPLFHEYFTAIASFLEAAFQAIQTFSFCHLLASFQMSEYLCVLEMLVGPVFLLKQVIRWIFF